MHWHVDPRWRVAISDRTVTFAVPQADCQLAVPRGDIQRFDGDTATGLGWWAPVYGNVEPATSLRISHRDVLPIWIVSVFGVSASNPVLDVEFVDVVSPRSTSPGAIAMRVARTMSIDYVLFTDGNAISRFDTFETDARVLFCRQMGNRVGDVIAIDGSRVHSSEHGVDYEARQKLPRVHFTAADAAPRRSLRL